MSMAIQNISGRSPYITALALSKLANLTRYTIRYYEQLGLIEPSKRAENNYRFYDPDIALPRLEFIKKCQQLGFSLHEIKELLDMEGKPCEKVKELLQNKIGDLLTVLEETETKLGFLRNIKEKWLRENTNNKAVICPLIEGL